MIAIRCDDREAEISGTADDLRAVRLAIIGLLSSDKTSAAVPASAKDPSPYMRSLLQLLIQRSAGPTMVTVSEVGLVVTASDDSLAKFSSWFNLPPDAQLGYHSHFEPMLGDQYHSSDSIPLVVAISHAGA